MTSLIERLRAISRGWGHPSLWDSKAAADGCNEAADLLEQARKLLLDGRAVQVAQSNTGFVQEIDAWLSLISGKDKQYD